MSENSIRGKVDTGRRLRQLWHSPRLRWWRRGGATLLTVLLVEYVLLPQIVDVRESFEVLQRASPWLISAALALEACSLLSYSALSRTALRGDRTLGYGTILRIDLTGLGASHLMVGGGAAAAGLRYRLLARVGVEPARIVASTAFETVVSVACLLVLFLIGVCVNLAALHPLLALSLAGLTAGVIGAAIGAPRRGRVGVRRRPEPAGVVLKHLPTYVRNVARQLAAEARDIQVTRGLLGRYLAWACGNWVMDAMCLATCLYAFGLTVGVGQLLSAYAAANLLALLPITPGGLGIVEGVMVSTLVAFGAPHGPALLGVLAWRVAEYWLPIPIAGLTYLSLRTEMRSWRAGTYPV